jgi:glycosyltransferase involved in cell wall biosynthesis
MLSPRLPSMALAPVQSTAPRVALVHDFLLDLRGAERVFLAMCDLWPQADIFTAVYDPEGTEGRFEGRGVQASFLQRLKPTSRTFRALLPLYPAAIESFDLSEYDLVVSSSSAWAHAVICDVDTVHVSYCHNPFRYAWNDRDRTLAERFDPVSRAALRHLFRRWRQWDWIAAQRVDRYLANSRATQRRIHSYWGRESTVVYPPVDTGRFAPVAEPGSSYLVLSELMRHKRIDVAIEAFNKLRLPLTVAGDGPEARRLRRMAGPTIEFTGRVSDDEAARLFATCRALVVPSVEEFGIVAVEAQAAGRPVLAVQAGGTCETVIDGVTGQFWSGGPDALADAVVSFDPDSIDPAACVENAERFARAAFAEALPREVAEALADARQADGIGRRTARVSARPRLGLGRRLG